MMREKFQRNFILFKTDVNEQRKQSFLKATSNPIEQISIISILETSIWKKYPITLTGSGNVYFEYSPVISDSNKSHLVLLLYSLSDNSPPRYASET